jgi:hypothetical protein
VRVTSGTDWAEEQQDAGLVDAEDVVAKRRISDDAAGFGLLLQLLADAGDNAEDPIPLAIETSRGLCAGKSPATPGLAGPSNPVRTRPTAAPRATPPPPGRPRDSAGLASPHDHQKMDLPDAGGTPSNRSRTAGPGDSPRSRKPPAGPARAEKYIRAGQQAARCRQSLSGHDRGSCWSASPISLSPTRSPRCACGL